MDSVRRFLFEDLDIRGALVALGPAWHALAANHDAPPPVIARLGELAAATALIAANLKTPGRLGFQLQGRGCISLLLVDCDEQLRLRGTVRHADAIPPAPTFGELFGDGQLVLTLRPDTGTTYQSIVPLVGDSLAEVLEHYLAQSEQQPAFLRLMADDDHAAGLFLQKLPEADRRDADGWNRVTRLAATARPAELHEPAATLLMRLFHEETLRLFDPRPVRHHCPRDEEKVLAMLRSLGRGEVESALAELGELRIEDDICRQSYRYGPEIIARLFD